MKKKRRSTGETVRCRTGVIGPTGKMPVLRKKPKPPSQRDRGYSNLLRHMSKNDKKQNDKLRNIERILKQIMGAQEDAAQELRDLKDELVKANTEIQAKIQALTDAANNAGNTVNPELRQAIDDLKPAAKALDDIVPDA